MKFHPQLRLQYIKQPINISIDFAKDWMQA